MSEPCELFFKLQTQTSPSQDSHDCRRTAGPGEARDHVTCEAMCQRLRGPKDGVLTTNTRLITIITSPGCDVLNNPRDLYSKPSGIFIENESISQHCTIQYLKRKLHSPASSRAPSVFQLPGFASTKSASSGWRDACSNESVCCEPSTCFQIVRE